MDSIMIQPAKHVLLTGRISNSGTTSLPSSISCLTSLEKYDDQYFLANSMDGSMKLHDHRMIQRGAVLSYEQTVGSASADVHHAVDPSEKFVMSGGVRLWSIKSGELLFEERLITSSIPFQYSWGTKEEHSNFEEAWVGAPEGLYRMRW